MYIYEYRHTFSNHRRNTHTLDRLIAMTATSDYAHLQKWYQLYYNACLTAIIGRFRQRLVYLYTIILYVIYNDVASKTFFFRAKYRNFLYSIHSIPIRQYLNSIYQPTCTPLRSNLISNTIILIFFFILKLYH